MKFGESWRAAGLHFIPIPVSSALNQKSAEVLSAMLFGAPAGQPLPQLKSDSLGNTDDN